MRIIKFRAWHKQTKEMLQMGDHNGTTHPCDPVVYYMQGQPVELMQFTGLLDKNGLEEIYEGDIISPKGIRKGNIYENEDVYEKGIDIVIEGMGTKTWRCTEQKAMEFGCFYPE